MKSNVRRVGMMLVAMFFGHSLFAQELSDFFSQKESDIKYMLQQIAALQVYIGYAEKGYSIAQEGLSVIGDIKKGEFDLHNVFFNSLKNVNPSISSYSKVVDIISYQLNIIADFKKAIQRLQQSGSFSVSEISYLNLVYTNITDQSIKSLNELIDIVTNGNMEMKDNERIKRIDVLYADMKNKYAFTQSFSGQASLLAAQRENELGETYFLQKLY
jgi:hypothetical protein